MKEKIFLALKQGYSHLGLGDSILQAHAEALAGLGLVTEENVQTVVDAQKGFLESLQRQNDRRVTDAVAKAKADAKADADKAVQAALDDAAKKADAKKTSDEPQPAQKSGDEIPDWYKAQKQASDKRMEELLAASKKLSEGFEALRKENETMKAEKAAAARAALIQNKAKELGIPEWRINEGFVIADNADETAITAHLATVASNIKALNLPGDRRAALSDGAPSKEEVAMLAKGLVG